MGDGVGDVEGGSGDLTTVTDRVVRLNASIPGTDTAEADELRTAVTVQLGEILDRPPAVELTSSCTHALEAAAVLLGVGPGDEVVVPAFTFPSTANAFLLRGATVRFADVDPTTGNVDPDEVERTISPATRAVAVMHYAGVACEMERIGELAAAHGADVVEDAAHGVFARVDGVPLGRLGRLAALSFHRTKNLSAVDGGALVVNDPDLVDTAIVAIDKGTNRVAFEEGRVRSYEWSGPGSAWRMPDPMVAVLAGQLAERDRIQAARHRAWSRYAAELRDWAGQVGATLPTVAAGVEHPAHIFWMALPPRADRSTFVAHCAERGVQTARHYGSLPASAYGRRIRDPRDTCPRAAELDARLVRLPLHSQLQDADVDRVLDAVTSFRA